ncbi:MAG: hypothetical protein AB7I57_04240 [Pirellulales bacterium]
MIWIVLVFLPGVLTCADSRAAVLYDEGGSGDLSGDYAHPAVVNLLPGSNVLIASTGVSDNVADLEYVNVNTPGGYRLSALTLLEYKGRDSTAFIGLQAGSAFTFDANDAFNHINDLLGWSHIGPGAGLDAGSDLLPAIGQGGQGFAPPLTGSSYTFWIQQTGMVMDYQLDFVLTPIPEPATSCFVLAAAAIAGSLRFGRIRIR